MVGIGKKLKGGTLVETLVAMILLVTTISLTFLSINSIKKSYGNELRAYSYMILSGLVESDTVTYGEDFIEYPSFTIYRTIRKNEKNPFVTEIKARALTNDSIILCEIKKYVKVNSFNRETGNDE